MTPMTVGTSTRSQGRCTSHSLVRPLWALDAGDAAGAAAAPTGATRATWSHVTRVRRRAAATGLQRSKGLPEATRRLPTALAGAGRSERATGLARGRSTRSSPVAGRARAQGESVVHGSLPTATPQATKVSALSTVNAPPPAGWDAPPAPASASMGWAARARSRRVPSAGSALTAPRAPRVTGCCRGGKVGGAEVGTARTARRGATTPTATAPGASDCRGYRGWAARAPAGMMGQRAVAKAGGSSVSRRSKRPGQTASWTSPYRATGRRGGCRQRGEATPWTSPYPAISSAGASRAASDHPPAAQPWAQHVVVPADKAALAWGLVTCAWCGAIQTTAGRLHLHSHTHQNTPVVPL